MKTTIIALILIVLVGLGLYFFTNTSTPAPAPAPAPEVTTEEPATTTPAVTELKHGEAFTFGTSAGGRDITAYNFGSGEKELMLVAGAHGGYSWNTSLLGFEVVDYLTANPSAIPAGVRVTVIPTLNPDGLFTTTGKESRFVAKDVPTAQEKQTAGRFNGNNVDLNRNFDCDWQANAKWQTKDVSGGTQAFSEPETLAFKTYVEAKKPELVVAYYSAAGGVFASNCHKGVLEETQKFTDMYAKASKYKAYQDFNFYEATGDMTNWLAKIGTPAISVLLTNHTSTEWEKNKAGIEALINSLAQL